MNLVFTRHIGCDGKRPGAGCHDSFDNLVRRILTSNIVDNDIGASLAESDRHSLSDA
jgi:hypothetical protein